MRVSSGAKGSAKSWTTPYAPLPQQHELDRHGVGGELHPAQAYVAQVVEGAVEDHVGDVAHHGPPPQVVERRHRARVAALGQVQPVVHDLLDRQAPGVGRAHRDRHVSLARGQVHDPGQRKDLDLQPRVSGLDAGRDLGEKEVGASFGAPIRTCPVSPLGSPCPFFQREPQRPPPPPSARPLEPLAPGRSSA
jgi:hypothetical protein